MGYYDALQKNHLGPLSQFGIKGNLIMGLPTPYIRIRNYDRYKRTELLRSVKALLGDDAKEIGYKKWNNKYFLECKMKSL